MSDTPNTPRMRQVLVRMPVEMHDALADMARREDRTIAAEYRRAVRLYIEAEETRRANA